MIVIWNSIHRWPAHWWGYKYLITALIIPGIVAVISTIWFTIGGIIDLRRMLRDLNNRTVDELDNGMVDGHVSLSDKKKFSEIEEKSQTGLEK